MEVCSTVGMDGWDPRLNYRSSVACVDPSKQEGGSAGYSWVSAGDLGKDGEKKSLSWRSQTPWPATNIVCHVPVGKSSFLSDYQFLVFKMIRWFLDSFFTLDSVILPLYWLSRTVGGSRTTSHRPWLCEPLVLLCYFKEVPVQKTMKHSIIGLRGSCLFNLSHFLFSLTNNIHGASVVLCSPDQHFGGEMKILHF